MDSSNGRLILLLLVVLFLFLFDANTCIGVRPTPAETTGVEFIRTSCEKTNYPRLCFESLSAYATTIKTSPTQLAGTALTISLNSARETSDAMARMYNGGGGKMMPREAEAMKDCLTNVRDSVDKLRRSAGEMGRLGGQQDLGLHINNVQTWVSAALTDEGTCMDGFAGKAMDGEVKNKVRGQILTVAQLLSNALSLVNGLASTQSISP